MNGPRPAGFWIRAGALAVDFALFFLVQVSFGFIGGKLWGAAVRDAPWFLPLVWFFTLVFAGAYTTLLHALGGQTIGKMLARVRVVVGDGEPPPLGTSLLRYAGYFASCATFGFGYLMAGLRWDKRALHDLIAGTRVERVPRETAPATPAAPEPPAETAAAPPGGATAV